MTDNLTKALDELIQQKTFSLEAVEAIKAIRDENLRLQEKVKYLDGKLVEEQRANAKAAETIREQTKELEELWKRESDLEIREARVVLVEGEAKTQAAVAAAYKDAMTIVFRNPVVQQSTFGQVPVPNGAGYYNMVSTSGGSTTKINET